MSIDLSSFKNTFFEESYEGLDLIESILIGHKPEELDNEKVNSIFRAAHSLKGGAASFDFVPVVSLTHILETYLDEVRNQATSLTQDGIDVTLDSVDVLKSMLQTYQSDEIPTVDIDPYVSRINALLSTKQETTSNSTEPESQTATSAVWKIKFIPDTGIFLTGNDPLTYLRELSKLGNMYSKLIEDHLPTVDDYALDQCYLGWEIELSTQVPETEITDIFDWIIDDCILEIEQCTTDYELENTEEIASTPQRRSGDNDNNQAEASSIRVRVDKIDALMNMVGELVITQSMLSQIGNNFDTSKLDVLNKSLSSLKQNTRELQETVMNIRMVPISFAFDRVPRIVYDLCKKLDKKAELQILGKDTELDKTLIQQLSEPLVHLVRNALDHGIESPEQRLAKGKSETGTLELKAYHHSGNIIIDITDDGAGIDKKKILEKAISKGLVREGDNLQDNEIYELLFAPGFSTAEVISDVSGRGVGMDVVMKNVRALGGNVKVKSELGKGSTFTISLPLTLAILDGQLISVAEQTFIIPIINIVELLQIDTVNQSSIAGVDDIYRLRDECIPILRLEEIFNINTDKRDLSNALMVIVESGNNKIGVVIDNTLDQQQVVIKNLEENYEKIVGILGATILGNGKVALILDIPGLITITKNKRVHHDNNPPDEQIA